MDVKRELFLPALKAALENKKVTWEEEITPQEWRELFSVAGTHHVLPMVYEAVYSCPAARDGDAGFFLPFRKQTIRAVSMQTMKTSEFLSLFSYLRDAGVRPLVVKGIVCRDLYPYPDYRMSADEDLLIPADQFEQCHQAMLAYGMQLSDPSQDIDSAYEISYGKQESPIYIELHKCLFPPESDAYGDLNRFFQDAHKRALEISADGSSIATMGYTDHLFYLICHAFKHFLHSGFGIRQVCDIVLFANAYGREIDWIQVLEQCRQIHAELFTAALFQIGQIYLTFDPEAAGYPEEWRKLQVDESLMLEDLLDAGVYGNGSMSRRHSSNMTLHAVSAHKQGKPGGHSVLKTLFPSARAMEKRFPYLKKYPWLLPAAWISRIGKYHRETGRSRNNAAAEAVAIGNRRIELLRKYKIIE